MELHAPETVERWPTMARRLRVSFRLAAGRGRGRAGPAACPPVDRFLFDAEAVEKAPAEARAAGEVRWTLINDAAAASGQGRPS